MFVSIAGFVFSGLSPETGGEKDPSPGTGTTNPLGPSLDPGGTDIFKWFLTWIVCSLCSSWWFSRSQPLQVKRQKVEETAGFKGAVWTSSSISLSGLQLWHLVFFFFFFFLQQSSILDIFFSFYRWGCFNSIWSVLVYSDRHPSLLFVFLSLNVRRPPTLFLVFTVWTSTSVFDWHPHLKMWNADLFSM